MKLEIQLLEQQLKNLFVVCPELETDEELRRDMIEGETEAHEVMRRIVRHIIEAKALANLTIHRIRIIFLDEDAVFHPSSDDFPALTFGAVGAVFLYNRPRSAFAG